MCKKYTLAVCSKGHGVICTKTGNKNKNMCSLGVALCAGTDATDSNNGL